MSVLRIKPRSLAQAVRDLNYQATSPVLTFLKIKIDCICFFWIVSLDHFQSHLWSSFTGQWESRSDFLQSRGGSCLVPNTHRVPGTWSRQAHRCSIGLCFIENLAIFALCLCLCLSVSFPPSFLPFLVTSLLRPRHPPLSTYFSLLLLTRFFNRY